MVNVLYFLSRLLSKEHDTAVIRFSAIIRMLYTDSITGFEFWVARARNVSAFARLFAQIPGFLW